MKRIPIVTDKNLLDHYPHFKQWSHRVTKVILFNLDGTTSEMKLVHPIITWCGDDQSLAGSYLSGLIDHLTRYFLKIKAYQVHLGSINDKGEEHYSIHFVKQEIPLNKVFIPSKKGFGKWENPETVKRREQKTKVNRMRENMKAGKHPFDGSPIKSKPRLASGIYLN